MFQTTSKINRNLIFEKITFSDIVSTSGSAFVVPEKDKHIQPFQESFRITKLNHSSTNYIFNFGNKLHQEPSISGVYALSFSVFYFTGSGDVEIEVVCTQNGSPYVTSSLILDEVGTAGYQTFFKDYPFSDGVDYNFTFNIKQGIGPGCSIVIGGFQIKRLFNQNYNYNYNFDLIDEPKVDPIQSSWMYRGLVTLSNNIVINSTTKIDLTQPIFAGTILNENNSPFYYDNVNNLIRVKSGSVDYFALNLSILLSGSVSSAGADEIFEISLHRPNETIFRRFFYYFTQTSQEFTQLDVLNIATFVGSGGQDPWQLPLDVVPATNGGFKVKISRISGNATLTLNNTDTQQIRLQR